MSFYKRYELDRLIADGEAKTFRAVDNQSGRAVLLHMFNPQGAPVLAALKAKLGSDPRNLRPPLLDLGEFAGSPYAVTEVVAGFTNLREWLEKATGEAVPSPRRLSTTEQFHSLFEDLPPSPASAPQNPAAITPARSPVAAAPAAQIPTPPPVPIPQASLPVEAAREAGEFTRLFGGSAPKPQPAAPQPASEPGEFTRMFGGGRPPAAPSNPAPPPMAAPFPVASPTAPLAAAPTPPIAPQAGPAAMKTETSQGEFTRWFKLEPESVKPARPPEPPPKPPGDDFERMFGPMPASNPAAPSFKEDRGEHTALFGMGQHAESINIEQEQARAARSAAPEAKPFQAPSEFTRMFGRDAGASRPLPPTPPAGPRASSASGLFGPATELGGGAAPLTRGRTQVGPGEYTRLIASPARDKAAQQQAQVAPAPPPKKNWLLIIGIAIPVLALVAIAIVAILRNR